MDVVVNVGIWSIVGVVLLAAITASIMGLIAKRKREAEADLIAYRDADRWCGLLHGQLRSMGDSDDAVAGQALIDAQDRYREAMTRLHEATDRTGFEEARRCATLGLRHIGVARARLGLVAGPQGPPPVTADGRPMYEAEYRAAPSASQARDGDDRYEKAGSCATPELRNATGS